MISRVRRALPFFLLLLAIVVTVAAFVGWPHTVPDQEPDVCYLLDVSRSHHVDRPRLLAMAWQRLRRAPPKTSWALAAFGDGVYVLRPLASGPVDAAGESEAFARLARLEDAVASDTDIGAAMAFASGLSREGRPVRAVIFGDGRYPPFDARDAVSVIGPLLPPAEDLWLTPDGPLPRLVRGTSATVALRVEGRLKGPRRVVVGDGTSRVTVPITGTDVARLLLRIRVPLEGDVRVRIEDHDGPDGWRGNDVVTLPVRDPEQRTITVVGTRADEVVALLKKAEPSWRIEAASDFGATKNTDVLVLANAPLPASGAAQQQALVSSVTNDGMGLVVLGGDRAFRAGGYASSPLDPLLPLSSRPEQGRDITVLQDVSGTMARRTGSHPSRLERACEAMLRLLERLTEEDRFQVRPFAATPLSAIPATLASPSEFRSLGVPQLLTLSASGSTRIGPAFEDYLRAASVEETSRRRLLVLVSDLRDRALDAETAVIARELASRRVELLVVLLDPDDETQGRARALGGTVVLAPAITPDLLIDMVDEGGWVVRSLTGRWVIASPPGAIGALPGFNPVVLGEGARLSASAEAEEPLIASVQRGAGQIVAIASDPLATAWGGALVPYWVRSVLPPDPDEVDARFEGDVLQVSGLALRGDLVLRLGTARFDLPQRGPSRWSANVPRALLEGPLASGGVAMLSGASFGGAARIVVPAPPDREFLLPPETFKHQQTVSAAGPAALWPHALLMILLAATLLVLTSRPGSRDSLVR